MNIVEATNAYEAWMARHTSIVQDDLTEKHKLIAESPFVFLRGMAARKDLAGRTGRWLERATRDMVDATISEQREWRKHRRRTRRKKGARRGHK